MSLAGKRIVVTRDPLQAGPFNEELRKQGAEVIEFPTILITDTDKPESVTKFFKENRSFDWLIFTSMNAVKYFFKLKGETEFNLDMVKIACVGKKTEEKLAEYNFSSNLTPNTFTAKQLLDAFKTTDVENKSILLPVSNIARKDLEDGLKKRGALVTRIEVYKTVPNKNLDKEKMISRIREKNVDCFTFFSPSAVNFFVNLLGMKVISLISELKIPVAAIGPATAKAVQANNLEAAIVPENSDYKEMVQALSYYFQNRK